VFKHRAPLAFLSVTNRLCLIVSQFKRKLDLIPCVLNMGLDLAAHLINVAGQHGVIDGLMFQDPVNGLGTGLFAEQIGGIGVGVQIVVDPKGDAVAAG